MVYRLYDAKPGEKALWIVDDAAHAESYLKKCKEYIKRVKAFLALPTREVNLGITRK